MLALVLSIMMIMGSVAAMADPVSHSITIHNDNPNISINGKTYSAFKLFDSTHTGTAYAYSMSTESQFYDAKLVSGKRAYPAHIAFLAGSILGAVLMFSNGAYRAISQDADWYRSMAHGIRDILDQAYSNCIDTIIPFGFTGCFVLISVLCVAACLASGVYRERISKRWKMWHDMSLTVIVAYTALVLMENVGKPNHVDIWKNIEMAATVLFVMAWICFLLTLPINSPAKVKLLLILSSAMIMDGCLLIVTPIGPGCMFGSYVFFCLMAVSLIELSVQEVNESKELLQISSEKLTKDLNEKLPRVSNEKIPRTSNEKLPWNLNKKLSRVFNDVMIIAVVVCAYYFVYIYGTIAYVDGYRLGKAREDIAAGQTTIQVQNVIYGEYVWNGNPDSGSVREERFKAFYGIDPDIRIENVN